MKNTWLKPVALAVGGLALLAGFLVIFLLVGVKAFYGNTSFGGGLTSPDSSRAALGATSTLSNNFADPNSVSTTAIFAKGMNNFVIGGNWVPAMSGSRLAFQVKLSIDNGRTYYDYAIPQDRQGHGLSVVDGVGAASTTVAFLGATSTFGIPFTLGSGTQVTSGTAISFTFPVEYFKAADYIKVLAQETTTGTHGTLTGAVLLTN